MINAENDSNGNEEMGLPLVPPQATSTEEAPEESSTTTEPQTHQAQPQRRKAPVKNLAQEAAKKQQAKVTNSVGAAALEQFGQMQEASAVHIPNPEAGARNPEEIQTILDEKLPTSKDATPTNPDTGGELRLSNPKTAASEKASPARLESIVSSSMTMTDEDTTESEAGPVRLATTPAPLREDDPDDELAEFSLPSVKTAMKVGNNPYIRGLRNFNPKPEEIVVEDLNDSDQDFQKAYMESRNNLLTAPRGVRVPFLMSGYHADISAVSHSDTIAIARHLSTPDYVQRMELILNAVFAHIIATSKGDVDFETWASMTKWPDIEAAYFGLYHAAYPGIQKYIVKCHSCKFEFPVDVDNEDLAYIAGKFVRESDVQTVMSGNDASIKKTLLYRKANPDTPIKHRLKVTKIYIEYSIPTVKEYMDTIRALSASDKFQNVGNIEDPRSPEFPFLRLYPFISRIALPVVSQTEEGKIVRYRGSYDRNIIVGTINALSAEDFDDLFAAQEVIDLVGMNSIRYALKPMVCPSCKAHIRAVPLSIKDTFFTRVQESSELE